MNWGIEKKQHVGSNILLTIWEKEIPKQQPLCFQSPKKKKKKAAEENPNKTEHVNWRGDGKQNFEKVVYLVWILNIFNMFCVEIP